MLTVGSIHAGNAANIIPEQAELLVNIRSADERVRAKLLDAITRVTNAEAQAAGAPKAPEIEPLHQFSVVRNDIEATEVVLRAIEATGQHAYELPELVMGSEDFGLFGEAAGCPSVFWHFGGEASFTAEELAALRERGIPDHIDRNHSPRFAPSVEPTLRLAVQNLLAAAGAWLG